MDPKTWTNPQHPTQTCFFKCFASFPSGLQGELRAEEEKVKEKDQEKRELEETVDVLRKELNKTEQARKDASIKVMKRRPQTLKEHETLHQML